MSKNNLKSHFRFAKSEQSGILLFAAIIITLLSVYFFVAFETEEALDTSSAEVLLKQKQIDSLRLVEMEARTPKLYPFNPNFITDYKAYTLGMPTEAYDKLQQFRKEDKWINSISDFKRVTGVSDVWLDSMSPYFKFPEWVTHPKTKSNYTSKFVDFNTEKSFSQKIDLNTATTDELQQISGIGTALSERIVNYRNTLGGFTDDVQLYEVYGLSPQVVERTKNLFTVKTPKPLEKLNINKASASDLATIPGISFDLGKRMWEFVKLREGIKSLEELEKIEGITANKIQRFQLYLFVE
ncbi:ComEA family DNA-binding protein [Rasiella sp. SM2506]|uniref:ComEA family DNA-binding protein n=1 Tax=Rasiella sp. SM2506 TaxID=3423914 RepID=UPI003D79FCCB